MPSTMPDGADWFVWMILAGRGWGKTRTAVENIARMLRGPTPMKAPPGAPAVMTIIADSPFDLRQYSIEGPSGFLKVGPPEYRPLHEPSKKTLTWPNGCKALLFSAEDPETLRGASGSFFWWDELAKSRYARAGWDNMLFGMREGNPRGIVTTTPRPSALLKELLARPSTLVTRGSTWDNKENLSPVFYREVIAPLMGTRLGRQEIEAEILDDVPGALWTRGLIEENRLPKWASEDERQQLIASMVRIVVAMDPAATSSDSADEMGIIVAGLRADGHGVVLADLSERLSPDKAARRAIQAYDDWQADRVVGEVNNGGEWIGQTIQLTAKTMRLEGLRTSPSVAYRAVHASRGKQARAEPIAALDEQHKIHHVGSFPKLEDQLCEWEPLSGVRSPDRLDARVWAFTDLMVTAPPAAPIFGTYGQR
ncbi:terminase family protein [Xanthobacter sp. VTT E-85241]|uniref:terminase large subunit domain-containing protein n=2 Tax=Pseudomonadota TaxID=1224 RepID=UPI00372B4604